MASMEEDFPRGGTEKKTTDSKKVKAHEVDNLFETRETVVTKKRKTVQQDGKQKTKQRKEERGDLKLNTETNVEILHLRNLKIGTLMLGCVKEVSDFEAVVGFPSGLVGYLPIFNICDSYTSILKDNVDSEDSLKEVVPLPQLLTPGMLIRCVVSSLDSFKEGQTSLKVSINPKGVNKVLSSGSLKPGMTLSGCVESVEDHGFLVDIGISGTKAFLPKQSTSSKKDLNVGQYMTVLIEEVKNDGRVVRLSQDPQALGKACAETQQGWTLDTLLPGLLIQARIKKVTPHGLILTYLSSFTGMVDFLHLDEDKASTYNTGDEVLARVLYVEPSTRHVGLSLRWHLLPPGGAVLDEVSSERVGEVVQCCKMSALHHHSGALMKMPDGTTVFVHKNLTKEAKEEFNPNSLLSQPELTLRIIDYSPMERMHMGTLRRSTVNTELYRYQDVKVGQIVEGTVMDLQKQGAYVRITNHIKGLIPRNHLADVVLKNPEKIFTSGLRVKCRVLSVDAQQKKLCLTRKKALVESTLPLFLSYADAKVGRVSHGFIVCVKDFGCIVRFYEDVKGLVPKAELSTEYVGNPEELFFVGQVVKAKVLDCDEEKKMLRLSFRAVTEGDVKEEKTAKFDFVVGKTVEVKVCRKVLDGLEVSILPEEVPAFIPTVHLSDHVTNCLSLWMVLEEGDTISNLMCLSKTKKRGITLTKKPLLKACLEDDSGPKNFSELQVGMQMVGWVKNIMPYGVFIDFPYELFGLAPKAAMSDQFVTDTSVVFDIGQTVVAKVTNLDEEKNRFLVSLRVSELISSEEESQARLIQGLKEKKAIFEMMTCRGESDVLQQLSAVSLGNKLKVTVGDSREDGSVTLTSDQLSEATVLVSKYHTEGVNVSPGCKLTAVVLHVDISKSEVHVSLLPKLTGTLRKKLEKDSKLTATVQYTDKEFAVVSLADTGHLTIIPTRTHINDILNSKKLLVGSCLNVTVKENSCEELGGLPLVECQKQNATGGTQKPEQSKFKSTGLGEVMTVTIKKVKPMDVVVTLPSGTAGSIHVSQIEESPVVGSFPTSTLKVGSKVEARVIGAQTVHGHKFLPISHPSFKVCLPELTLLPSKLNEADKKTVDKLNYKPGDEVTCFASKFDKESQCLEVHVKPNVMGTVELLAMITKASQAKHPQTLFKLGQTASAKVVGLGNTKPFRLSLSLTGTYKMEQGVITMAKVWKIVPHMGLFLQLPFGNSGLASLTDLSDEFTDNPLEPYKLGQLVRCYVIGEENENFNISLRPSRLYKDHNQNLTDPDIQSISDIKEGQIIRGYLMSVTDLGIFVRLSRTISGRVLFQNASKYFVNDQKTFSEHIPANALLTAKVLSVNSKNEHVNLSLLPKDTGKPDLLPESLELPLHLKKEPIEEYVAKATKRKRVNSESQQEDDAKNGQTIKKKKEGPVKSTEKKKTKKRKPKTEDNDSGVEVFFREEEVTPLTDQVKVNLEAKEPERLQMAFGFSWGSTLCSLTPFAAVDDTRDSSEDEQEVTSKPMKKSRKELKQEQQNVEQQLSKLEAELMDTSVRPDSTVAFERLLLSSPDSSLLWLQYMAFHLQATQIEQARAVGERALKTISFREEREKLNVWVAMLNLENMYGTQESLQKVFERAIQFCEPLPVYQQLADIYAKSDKIKEAENLYKSMVKRFKQEKAVYLSYGNFLLRQRQSDAANALLQRALQSLSNKEHVDLIAKFARLEFQYGNAEKAKSMFEKVLSTYPKRTDLWSVFIDLMVKHGSQKEVRELFDRVIHLSVSVKKIKFFFKRYLEYEKKNGTPETIQAVKQKALEYVESKGAEAAS
ncbi:protein RRP5 homolog isoform X1 [Carassius gibelio]|uniref:protein RRP5 homolog isoform X1 n=1 Tax=Carassius gibelio TaxID=101364 RepID=UPI0022779C8B|nr:protein RRP5 homolog isoform X1 [Carassius gibelio]